MIYGDTPCPLTFADDEDGENRSSGDHSFPLSSCGSDRTLRSFDNILTSTCLISSDKCRSSFALLRLHSLQVLISHLRSKETKDWFHAFDVSSITQKRKEKIQSHRRMIRLEISDWNRMDSVPVSRELSAISHWPINLISRGTSASPDRYVDADLICRSINLGSERYKSLLNMLAVYPDSLACNIDESALHCNYRSSVPTRWKDISPFTLIRWSMLRYRCLYIQAVTNLRTPWFVMIPFSGILTRHFFLHQHRFADIHMKYGNVIRSRLPFQNWSSSLGTFSRKNVLSNLERKLVQILLFFQAFILTCYFFFHQHRFADIDIKHGNVIRGARGCNPGSRSSLGRRGKCSLELGKGKRKGSCRSNLPRANRVRVNCKLYFSAWIEPLLQARLGFLPRFVVSLDGKLRLRRVVSACSERGKYFPSLSYYSFVHEA